MVHWKLRQNASGPVKVNGVVAMLEGDAEGQGVEEMENSSCKEGMLKLHWLAHHHSPPNRIIPRATQGKQLEESRASNATASAGGRVHT